MLNWQRLCMLSELIGTPLAVRAAEFTNSTAGGLYVDSAGHWLADPAAVLVGTADGAAMKALVKLSSPKLSADGLILTFQVGQYGQLQSGGHV